MIHVLFAGEKSSRKAIDKTLSSNNLLSLNTITSILKRHKGNLVVTEQGDLITSIQISISGEATKSSQKAHIGKTKTPESQKYQGKLLNIEDFKK